MAALAGAALLSSACADLAGLLGGRPKPAVVAGGDGGTDNGAAGAGRPGTAASPAAPAGPGATPEPARRVGETLEASVDGGFVPTPSAAVLP